MHETHAPPSREHAKLAASLAVNQNVADLESGRDHCAKRVSGAIVSTVHLACAGEASTFPAASIARTSNAWAPCARPLYEAGDAHSANAAPSSEHSKRESGSLENEIAAVVDAIEPLGADAIEVSGGVVSAAAVIVATCAAATLPAAEAVIVGEPGSVSR